MIKLLIRELTKPDIPILVAKFKEHDWDKPSAIFETYLSEQTAGERIVLLAIYDGELAGYITVKWRSKYIPFLKKNIPEIMDFNVLPPYRNQGIGLELLQTAEATVAKRSPIVGLGVGLYSGYGNAHKMYIKTGYIPDELGITYNYKRVEYGEQVVLDDDLVLWFTKKLDGT